MSAEVRVERRGPLGLLILDAPQRLNALSPGMCEIVGDALERLKGVGARAARLYERAARLDGLLSGREEAAAVRTPEPMTARPARLSPPKRGIRTQAGAETRPAAGRAAAAEAGPDASPDARGRLIWLSEALAAEAWG